MHIYSYNFIIFDLWYKIRLPKRSTISLTNSPHTGSQKRTRCSTLALVTYCIAVHNIAMAAVYAAAMASLLLTALTMTSYRFSSRDKAVSSAGADRNLTVYAMAVGQGDGNIIVCPNGRDILIVDMGAKVSQYTNRDYGAYLLREKFKVVENQMNIHIVVTHTDEDHYNFLPYSFADSESDLLERVEEVVVGNKLERYGKAFHKWINNIDNMPPVYTVNNGSECFGNSDCQWTLAKGTPSKHFSGRSDPWQFCGGDVSITVLGANICVQNKKYPNRCSSDNANARSVIMKLTYKEWSVFLSGDFEGVGQQQKLLDHWSREPSIFQSTYYKVSHHGAWTKKKANWMPLLQAVRPKRAYISQGHPIKTFCVGYSHPRCEVIDHLINVGSIERVKTTPEESAVICWKSKNKSTGDLELRRGYAIYETCRDFNITSDKPVCRDIRITTNGFDDHTSHVDVPPDQVYTSKSSSKVKPSCLAGQDMMKRQLLDLFPLSLLF